MSAEPAVTTKPSDAIDIAHALADIEGINVSVVDLMKSARDVLELADAKITDDTFAAGKLWEYIPAVQGTPMITDPLGVVTTQGVAGSPAQWQQIDETRYGLLRVRIELLRSLLQVVTQPLKPGTPSFASLLREQSTRWGAK